MVVPLVISPQRSLLSEGAAVVVVVIVEGLPQTSCVLNILVPRPAFGSCGCCMLVAPHGLLAAAVMLTLGCCDPRFILPKASNPADGCRGDALEYRERISFLFPFVDGAAESVGEVGPECQSRSKRPPPAPAVLPVLVTAVGDAAVTLAAEAATGVTPPVEDGGGGGESSNDELCGFVTLAVAGPGPISPPRRSMALAAGARGVEEVVEDDAGAALEDAANGAAVEVPPSRVLGSDGTGPSFAHLFTSYLLRIKLSTLCSGGM